MRAKEVADAIRSMEIRGAAEIARRAAIALKDEALAYSRDRHSRVPGNDGSVETPPP